VPVVIGARDPEARLVLTSLAAQRQSAMRLIDRDFSYLSHAPAHRLDYHGLGLDLRDLEIGLAGPFQHENAAIAAATLEALRAQGWRIDEDAIRRGMREIFWPGRFDIVSKRPLVILDCAHNEMSIAALLDTMSVELGPDVKPRLIFGCQSAKEWTRMAAMLGPRVRDVMLTRARPKAPLEPEELVAHFAKYCPARVERDPMRAIDRLISEMSPDDVALVTGSVYLIGEVYPHFLSREGKIGLFPEAGA
jgi:dihydrofolate synthase / folylpolyglutamate synthase